MKSNNEKLPPGLPCDPLDDLLVAALRARNEPAPAIDLATAALARVHAWQTHEQNLARLARLNRWMHAATFSAAALIAVTLAVGYKYWPASTESTDTLNDATTAATYTPDWTTLGVAIFIATLTMVLLTALFTPDRPQLRTLPG
jgi:hypothetical protein